MPAKGHRQPGGVDIGSIGEFRGESTDRATDFGAVSIERTKVAKRGGWVERSEAHQVSPPAYAATGVGWVERSEAHQVSPPAYAATGVGWVERSEAHQVSPPAYAATGVGWVELPL